MPTKKRRAPTMTRAITRRTMLRLGALTGAAAVLTACGENPPPPATPKPAAPPAAAATPAGSTAGGAPAQPTAAAAAPKPTTAPAPASAPGKFQEAPMLADLVKAGKLPAVDQRLPASPLVVKPLERNGNDLIRNIGYEQLMRYTPGYDAVIPNVAESVKASDDGKEYTFTLRKGLKWSDGSPFTSEDVLFWY